MKHEADDRRKTPPRLHVVLVHPQIPQNTGNIARMTAGTGCRLHLIEPLGFSLADKYLKRAGLDYWPSVDLAVHTSYSEFVESCAPPADRTFYFSTHGTRSFRDPDYQDGDWLVFGREADGLPSELSEAAGDQLVTIPLDRSKVRSLNLSNAVAVAVYEALR